MVDLIFPVCYKYIIRGNLSSSRKMCIFPNLPYAKQAEYFFEKGGRI